MKSYESSKWYIKVLRHRWYFYIPFLYTYRTINFKKIIGYIVVGIEKGERERLFKDWFDVKKHIDLTKLKKYSTK